MTDPTARDLIQRLADALKTYNNHCPYNDKPHDKLLSEARAYLTQPEPAADGPAVPDGREPASVINEPTDAELHALGQELYRFHDGPTSGEVAEIARAVLARYSRQPPQPIPLSERLPGPEDCDAEGRCYLWDWLSCDWKAIDVLGQSPYGWGNTFWLPYHALPLPEVN